MCSCESLDPWTLPDFNTTPSPFPCEPCTESWNRGSVPVDCSNDAALGAATSLWAPEATPCSPGRGHCSSSSNLNLVSSAAYWALYIKQLLSSQMLSPARSQLERSINKRSYSFSGPKAAMQEVPDVPDILHPTATGAIQLESHKIASNKALEQKGFIH